MTDAPTVIIETPTGTVEASKATLPDSGRKFRNAWRAEGDAITVDMAAAREIAREQIRQARVPLMLALDVAYMKATEGGAATQATVSSKQALRDAPADPRIDEAQTDAALAEAVDAIIAEMQA